MADLDTATQFGKKISEQLGRHSMQPTNDHLARHALRDLMLFNNAVESELKTLRERERTGTKPDASLMEKMQHVKDKYNYAMSGFKAFDDDMQKNALAALADAISDLMLYVQARRSH